MNLSTPETPVITGDQALIDAIYTPANYDLDEIEREFTTNEDTEISLKFDAALDSQWGDTPVTYKFGTKLRQREKVRDKTFA